MNRLPRLKSLLKTVEELTAGQTVNLNTKEIEAGCGVRALPDHGILMVDGVSD